MLRVVYFATRSSMPTASTVPTSSNSRLKAARGRRPGMGRTIVPASGETTEIQ